MVRVHLDPPEKLPREPIIGALAQLVERLLCKQDVVGSTPSGSTKPRKLGLAKPDGSCDCRPSPAGRLHHHMTIPPDLIGQPWLSRPVGRCGPSGSLHIVQRDNQRCRLYPSGGAVVDSPSGLETNGGVVQVKYTNQVTAYAVAGIDTCF